MTPEIKGMLIAYGSVLLGISIGATLAILSHYFFKMIINV